LNNRFSCSNINFSFQVLSCCYHGTWQFKFWYCRLVRTNQSQLILILNDTRWHNCCISKYWILYFLARYSTLCNCFNLNICIICHTICINSHVLYCLVITWNLNNRIWLIVMFETCSKVCVKCIDLKSNISLWGLVIIQINRY